MTDLCDKIDHLDDDHVILFLPSMMAKNPTHPLFFSFSRLMITKSRLPQSAFVLFPMVLNSPKKGVYADRDAIVKKANEYASTMSDSEWVVVSKQHPQFPASLKKY